MDSAQWPALKSGVKTAPLKNLTAKNLTAKSLTASKGYNGVRPNVLTKNSLEQIAIKRNADMIASTEKGLKGKLVHELDQVIAKNFAQHPELKQSAYIAVIIGEPFRAEVVERQVAAKAVEDLPLEEAEKRLKEAPVGYFQKSDFTLKTPDDPSLQAFKKSLDTYFSKNESLFKYLKSNF